MDTAPPSHSYLLSFIQLPPGDEAPLYHLMGLHNLLLLTLLLLLDKREVAALDLDVTESQLVVEGGEVELVCQVKW